MYIPKWYQPTTLGRLKGFHAKNAKFTTHDLEIPQNSWESLHWTSIRHVSANVWWMLGYRVQLTILGLEKKLTMLATSSSHDYLELQYLIYKPWTYCQAQVTCLLGGWAVFSLDTLLWEQRPGLRGRHGHQPPHSALSLGALLSPVLDYWCGLREDVVLSTLLLPRTLIRFSFFLV